MQFYRFGAMTLVFLLSVQLISGQSSEDLKHLKKVNFERSEYSYQRQVNFGIEKKEGFFRKYNPVNLVFSSLMFSYQRWISPQISADCLFHPTCSSYSQSLFMEYGFFRGLIFSSDRFMRCDRISATSVNPISVDPVDGKIHETPERYHLKHND